MNIKGFKTSLEWKKIFTSKEFEEKYVYLYNDLGNTYSKEKTIFKVWAPTAENVTLNLYTTGSDNEENAKNIGNYAMMQEDKGVWVTTINEDLKNLYYTYTITANGETQETNDINARACGVNGKRSMIIDLEETNPEDWEKDKSPDIPLEERIIYELHIKDFSYNENSGIDEKFRGKYLAFTQKGTNLYGDNNYPTGIDYLKSLGITYVHLLPFYDFGSIDESNEKDDFNWGYDPINYNVPEGSYSTNPYDGRIRIKEVKEMIKALHSAGICVIMDVVYNHTYNLESNFNKTVPYYYYRINDNGEYSDASDCGNETASDNIMYRKYMIASVLYWAKEYHIDGFRFDLMGIHDTETMNEIRKALDDEFGKGKILIYGEPWASGAVSLREGNAPAIKENIKLLDNNISAFCDLIRDLIKGDVFIEKSCGYINSNGKNQANLKQYLMKIWKNEMIENFTGKFAKQFINYISTHDNLTLWDKLIITNNKEPNFKNFDKDIVSQNKLAAGIVFTNCGIPFFQAGEEFARTKEGDENSYKSSASINALDWERTKTFRELVEYYKQIIKIRKELPILCNPENDYIKEIKFIEHNSNLIAFLITKSEKCNQNYREIMVIYNPENDMQKVELEGVNWKILFNEEACNIKENYLIINSMNITILGKNNI